MKEVLGDQLCATSPIVFSQTGLILNQFALEVSLLHNHYGKQEAFNDVLELEHKDLWIQSYSPSSGLWTMFFEMRIVRY